MPRCRRSTTPHGLAGIVLALIVVGICAGVAAPAGAEPVRVRFPEGPTHGDQSGRYDAWQRKHGEEERRDAGTTEIPEDTSNGLTSVLAKNLEKGDSAAGHLLTFRPEPLLLDLSVTPEGRDPYWVGSARADATRFRVEPQVPGVKGVLAAIVGKEPPTVRMGIAPEPVPVLVRFEGALFVTVPSGASTSPHRAGRSDADHDAGAPRHHRASTAAAVGDISPP